MLRKYERKYKNVTVVCIDLLKFLCCIPKEVYGSKEDQSLKK